MKKKEVKQKALPTGWREVRLGEVCSIDKRVLSSQTPHDYCFDYISLSDIERGRLLQTQKCKYSEAPSRARRIVAKGDVLLATVRPYLQGFYIFRNHVKDCIVSTGFAVLSPKSNLLNSSYLYEILFSQYMMATYHAFNVGSNYPAVNSSDIRKFKIPLPPLPEQKAIASLLEKWDTAIEKTEALIAAKEKRFKWLLKRLISDQQNNPEWRKVKLEDLCTKILGGGTPSTANIDYWKGHIPWMTSADIVNAKTINTRKYITAQAVTDSTTNLIPRNNIIVVTRVGIGKAVKNEMDICISQDSQGLILKKSISADFLIHCLLEKIKVFKSVSQGSTIQGITKKRLSDIEFPLPSLPEQKQIAQHINIVEREIGLLKELTEKYHTQKRGLMQKLLTGEWRRRDESANG